jgi:hypothetical protein
MSTMKWTTDLRIRSKTLAGVVLHTYKPVLDPTQIDPNPDLEQLDRRLADADGTDSPVVQGFRWKLALVLVVKDGCVKGASGYSDLEDVITDYLTRNILEVALHTTDFKRVNVSSAPVLTPYQGKNNALQCEVEFAAAKRQKTFPKLNGSAW